MNTTTRTSTAERLGRAFGRGWRAYARRERRASNWLVSKGMPRAGATALVWVAKLAVLGVLLYVAFWFALVMLGVAAAGAAGAEGRASLASRAACRKPTDDLIDRSDSC